MGRNDPSPQYPQSASGSGAFFPPGSQEPGASSSTAASAALNATVHLLQKFSSPSSLPASAKLNSPFGSASITVRPVMASTDSLALQRRKLCFVTVGATAPFDTLVQAVQASRFISALEANGFTNLLIQHGHKGQVVPTKEVGGIRISSFDFRQDNIQREVTAAKGDISKAKAVSRGSKSQLEGLDFGSNWQDATWEEGVVISHAGSGSILDALRCASPLIVVPNASLLDNHQIELAKELAKQGYVVHGKIENLTQSLTALENLRQNRKTWPPIVDPNDRGGRGLIGIMDEEMGYTDLKGQTKGSRLYLD